jgi:sensor histidine kinase YesM
MKARFEENLVVNWNIAIENGSTKFPVLLLQPILENTMRHGWRNDGSPLIVSVTIYEDKQRICISIKDNGQGISQQRQKVLPVKGHALANIAERLKLTYKRSDLLSIQSIPNEGTEINIEIPKEKV